MGEYLEKGLVLEQWGYENCQEMGITCWKRLYDGTLFWLVFSQPCRLKGVGGLVRIEYRTSGCVAHMADLAGNSGFLQNRGQTHCAWVTGLVVGVVWHS